MFNNRNIAIIDVGSDKIFVKIGEITKDNNIYIISKAEMFYDGFMDGDWLQGDEISTIVSQCLNKALYNLNIKLSAIYVGVPGDFARVQICTNKVSFGCDHKICQNDIQMIVNNTPPKNDGRFEVVDMQVVNYVLDRRVATLEPVSKNCFELAVNLSYNLCKKSFCDLFRTILADYTKKVKFIDLSLAESLFATEKKLRITNSAVLVDIGYLTTDVSCIMGGGLIALNSLPYGGGHVAYDLSYGLEISYNEACFLKSQVDFNSDEGVLSISTNSGVKQYDKSYVNMIAGARLEEIADNITNIISHYRNKYDEYLKIYLTGRGIFDMNGVRAFMAKALGRQCECVSDIIKYDEQNDINLSEASLINYICKNIKPQKTSLLSKIFRF